LVAHPTSSNAAELQSVTPRARFEAWYLALWYVELALLKLLGYDGQYNNRLNLDGWEGEYASVPWAPQSAP